MMKCALLLADSPRVSVALMEPFLTDVLSECPTECRGLLGDTEARCCAFGVLGGVSLLSFIFYNGKLTSATSANSFGK